MSKAVNAVIVGLTVFILLTGSIWYVTVARGPSRVSATEVEQGWESVNETTSALWAQITFRNPYDFRIDLLSFNYEFWVNEERWAKNNSTDLVRLEPRGEAVLPARVEFNTTDMDDWFAKHIANNERTTVLLEGNATFRVGGGDLAVPFERSQTWETSLRRNLEALRNCPQEEPAPCIADAAVKWVLDDNATLLQLVLTLRNNNLDDMTVSNRSASLALGDVVIAATSLDQPVSIGHEDARFFEFPLTIQPDRVIDWWIHHVQACETSAATIALVFDYEVTARQLPPQPTPTSTPTTPTTTSSAVNPPPPPPTTTSSTPPPTTTSADPTPTTSADPTPTTTSADPTPTTSADPTPTTTSADPTPTTSADPTPTTTSADPTPTTSADPTPTNTSTDTSPTHTVESTPLNSTPATEPIPTTQTSQTSSTTQSWSEGLRNVFQYPWNAAALRLGLIEPETVNRGRPTTNGVERITWDLELGDFRTGFACSAEP